MRKRLPAKAKSARRATIAKLVAPRTSQVVLRPRISTSIERALKAGICWLWAPAGYGKSVAAAEFVAKKSLRHIWYRVDEGDQDIASFFHYLALSLDSARDRAALPVFGAEYADQPTAFARRFCREFFSRCKDGTLLVLDDLHNADTPRFRETMMALLTELPASMRCMALSRNAPGSELTELKLRGGLTVLDRSVLKFSDAEARTLVNSRLRNRARLLDIGIARGWAAGLVLLSERASSATAKQLTRADIRDEEAAFAALATHFFATLSRHQRDALLAVSVLPEIRRDLVNALVGARAGTEVLQILEERQLLLSRSGSNHAVFHLHDLLRDYLLERIESELPPAERKSLRVRAATVLESAGFIDQAVALTLQAREFVTAHRLIAVSAERLLAQGRRATLVEWCAALPDGQIDADLSYWLGVATTHDDATAERWFARAWQHYSHAGDLRGQCLTAARAVLAKTDSWRTHEGLAAWTERMTRLLEAPLPELAPHDELLVRTGMLRALDFASNYRMDTPIVEGLSDWLLRRLAMPREGDSTLRLLASAALIEHAGSIGKQVIFEQAVDSVADDLRTRDALPWACGLWLVAFGAVSGRYFAYARRGFPYASAEEALRAAIAIGEREALRGVEFGALYHLQLQLKVRNDFDEFAGLVTRLAQIADSRYTTQVAVVADCQAALHTYQQDFSQAYRACERFNAAIEAANEPPIERWPHYITQFQVMLADRKPLEAAAFLQALLKHFDGGVRQRTLACIDAAVACDAKWRSSSDYSGHLRTFFERLRAANWPAVMLNLPSLLAELCADGLDFGIDRELCLQLIERRKLAPPKPHLPAWPWPLKVKVLGDFRMELHHRPLNLGAKPPTRSLEIVRVLASAKEHACSLEQLYEWLWPDADGDQAKSACEQALHRLRKLLGSNDFIVLREGKLRFAPDKVWVDLIAWETRLRDATAASKFDVGEAERLFYDFQGPLLQSDRTMSWSLPAGERVRGKFIELALRLGKHRETAREFAKARSAYLRAIDMYPTSERAYLALLQLRLAEGDTTSALEDFRRYERVLASTLRTQPSRAIRSLVAPLLG